MGAETFDAGPLLPVRAEPDERDARRWTLVLTRELRHAPQTVWAALTDPAQLARWAPFEADRDLGRAGAAVLTMLDGDTRIDLPSSVTFVQAPRLLEYAWGDDLLRWELTPTPGGTRLTLRHTVAEQDWLPKVAAGWHLCLAVVERCLDGRPVPPIRGAVAMDHGWARLHEAYADDLGVEATPLPDRG